MTLSNDAEKPPQKLNDYIMHITEGDVQAGQLTTQTGNLSS